MDDEGGARTDMLLAPVQGGGEEGEESQEGGAVGEVAAAADDTNSDPEYHAVEADNRPEASFDDEEEELASPRNFSVIWRWQERSHLWSEWLNGWKHTMTEDTFEPVPDVPKHEDMHLLVQQGTSEVATTSELGKQLLDFNVAVQAFNVVVQAFNAAEQAFNAAEQAFNEAERENRSIEGTTVEFALTSEERRGFEQLEPTMQRRFVRLGLGQKRAKLGQKRAKLGQKRTELLRKAENIQHGISMLLVRHTMKEAIITGLSQKGNENVLTSSEGSYYSLDSGRFDKSKVPKASSELIVPEPSRDLVDSLNGKVTADQKATLARFQTYLSQLVAQAVETDDADSVKHTIGAILDWENQEDFVKEDNKEYAWPPTTNQDRETTADQPILHAILCRILRLISSPSDTCVVTSEQQTHGDQAKVQRVRKIDLTVQIASMVGLPVEIKPVASTLTHFKGKLEKARSQIVGHLGRKLLFSFNFGGAGVDEHSTGIVLTPLTVEVVSMGLNKVGTKDVEIVCKSTGVIPLGFKKMHEDAIFPDSNKNEKGLVVLAGALTEDRIYAQKHDVGLTISQVSPAPREELNVRYLGSGAFANVFEVGNSNHHFMKVPKSAETEKALWAEAAILLKLSDVPDVPKLALRNNQAQAAEEEAMEESKASEQSPGHEAMEEDEQHISNLQVIIRDEVSEMIGLRLTGIVGTPLSKVPRAVWNQHCRKILSTVLSALKSAHSKGIYHMDVRPSNIVVDVTTGGAMLSDWGCALHVKNGKRLRRFRGCVPYAHDSLLTFKTDLSAAVTPNMDFASLVYTIDHVHHGKLRWLAEFDRSRNISSTDKERRLRLVNEFLQQEDNFLLKDLSQLDRNIIYTVFPCPHTRNKKRARG